MQTGQSHGSTGSFSRWGRISNQVTRVPLLWFEIESAHLVQSPSSSAKREEAGAGKKRRKVVDCQGGWRLFRRNNWLCGDSKVGTVRCPGQQQWTHNKESNSHNLQHRTTKTTCQWVASRNRRRSDSNWNRKELGGLGSLPVRDRERGG